MLTFVCYLGLLIIIHNSFLHFVPYLGIGSKTYFPMSLAEVISSGAGTFHSGAGDHGMQEGFPELGKTQERAETCQEPAALPRVSG